MPGIGICESHAQLQLISLLLTALGLSAASGLRAYLPLLAVAGSDLLFPTSCDGGAVIPLSTPVQRLLGDFGSSWVLVAVLAVLAGGEFVIDKVPVLDHASDLVHTVVRPLAGAAVMAGISNPLSEWNPWAAAAVGAILALSVHGAKAATRPAVTATTAGLGNPVVSVIEDIIAVVLTALSVLAPFLAIIFFVLLALLFIRTAGRTLRWIFGGGRSGRLASASGVPSAGRVPPTTTPGTPPGSAPTWPDMP